MKYEYHYKDGVQSFYSMNDLIEFCLETGLDVTDNRLGLMDYCEDDIEAIDGELFEFYKLL